MSPEEEGRKGAKGAQIPQQGSPAASEGHHIGTEEINKKKGAAMY